jgi:hypothetical protein
MRLWPRKTKTAPDHHAAPAPAEIRAAYERGRRDERARRRRSPIMALAVGSAALVGGAALALAALEGSFANGGAIMDEQVSKAAQQAGQALHDATRDPDASPASSELGG